ncbi:hypothetical protein CYMTET_6776 [Cymbomonas tetramitiformis]|uniref:RanBP2-type domain-containing protein n=1 Tax=Cymbomonas tetramitiformis TaxID=36881 RepID=A0AAE0GWX7_9CHLO|nr:hypothetical protein CYMTET_6776 [Cymbomonas tetramitiformis]
MLCRLHFCVFHCEASHLRVPTWHATQVSPQRVLVWHAAEASLLCAHTACCAGDPGAAHGDRRPPTPGVKGNWECKGCNNINFPRRTNCLRCHTARDEEAEKIVQDYVKGIIEQAQAR